MSKTCFLSDVLFGIQDKKYIFRYTTMMEKIVI